MLWATGANAIGSPGADPLGATFRLDVRRLGLHARRYHARDLWAHRTHTILRWIRARVPSRGVALFRVTPGH